MKKCTPQEIHQLHRKRALANLTAKRLKRLPQLCVKMSDKSKSIGFTQ